MVTQTQIKVPTPNCTRQVISAWLGVSTPVAPCIAIRSRMTRVLAKLPAVVAVVVEGRKSLKVCKIVAALQL